MTPAPYSTLSHLTFVAIQAALQAGTILRQGFGSTYQIRSKPGRQNIVTEYDHASEESIISTIHRHFPHHSILAEESGFTVKEDKSEILWIIDPLDGTNNFARQIPIFTISIAVYEQKQGLAAVIFQPMTQELFIAEKRLGAYLNGVPLTVSSTETLEEAVMGAGFPSYPSQNPAILNPILKFASMGAVIRNLGSAALSLAYVAAGKLDAFWMDYLYPWDLAAGKLLIEEAGGQITQYNGQPHQMEDASTTLASNPLLYASLSHHLQSK